MSTRLKEYVPLYTLEDKEKLELLMPEINKQVNEYKNIHLSPELMKKKEAMEIVGNYIKEHKLKIYGGHAQNLTIKKYDPIKQFYTDPDDLHDYDTYSTDPINDGMNITRLLYEKGYKPIFLKEAMHFETYSVSYDGFTLCDLSYVPRKIFNLIPFDEVDGFNVCKAVFYNIDFLRMFIDPMSSSFRWTKQIDRFMLIQSTFPMPDLNEPLLLDDPALYPQIKPEYKKIIKNYLKQEDNNLLITCFYAYNKYISLNTKSKKSKKLNLKKIKNPPFTLIATSHYKDSVIKFMEFLKLTFKNQESKPEISFNEKYNFFQFKDTCTEIYLDKILVATIYKNNNICIPYITINKLKFCSFQYNLLFMYVESFYARVYSSEFNKDENIKLPDYAEHEYHKLAVNLLKLRNNYLATYKLSCFEESPFQDFIVKCQGEIISANRFKIEHKTYKPFKFDPEKNKTMGKLNFQYSNCSGEYITKQKDMKILI